MSKTLQIDWLVLQNKNKMKKLKRLHKEIDIAVTIFWKKHHVAAPGKLAVKQTCSVDSLSRDFYEP